MSQTINVPRELLEDLRDCANECYNHARMRGTSGLDNYERLTEQADAILAAPRQPEGDGLEVVGVLCVSRFKNNPAMENVEFHLAADVAQGQHDLCHLSVAQRAIADLREECSFLKDCQENAMLHMTGLVAERDTLRQQLVERDAEILEQCRLNGMGAERELKLIAQRDKLAGLLSDALKLGELDRVLSLQTRVMTALTEVEG